MAESADSNPPEPSDSKPASRGIGHYIKAVAAFGGVIKTVAAFGLFVTVFMAGFGISSNQWSSSNTVLQAELGRKRDEIARTQDELAKVKSDCALQAGSKLSREGDQKGVAGPATDGGTLQGGLSGKSQNQVEVRVTSGNSATVLGGDLSISLIGTKFESGPPRFKVFASAISPGHPQMKIGDADVGYQASYPGKRLFSIEILAADSFSATFRVIGN